MKNISNETFYEIERASRTGRLDLFKTLGCDPHFHPDIEILVVTKGKISVTINNNTRILNKGDISFADAFDVHFYDILEPGSIGYVIIPDIKNIAPYTALTKKQVLKENFLTDDKIFKRVEQLIVPLTKTYQTDCDLYKHNIVLSVVGLITYGIGFEKKTGRESTATMRDILAYMHSNITENISAASVARQFGYTPNHFSHIFNSYTNLGFKEYLNYIRVGYAADLLTMGEKVLDTAMKSGFDSLRTFYRAFSERYGITPKKYAKNKSV